MNLPLSLSHHPEYRVDCVMMTTDCDLSIMRSLHIEKNAH